MGTEQTISPRLRLQLWSYNYDPEPTGIGPVSAVWARGMRERGHEVQVVAAHPHYPEPHWGSRWRPYRETRDGVPILRLPLAIGRATAVERLRQELSFAAVQAAAAPFLGDADVLVAVSPSFPALAPAMVSARLRRKPWVLWLQDILPEGAATTGLVKPGRLLGLARSFEDAAYRSAHRIVVISETFESNLRGKRVPKQKMRRIYNPATREPAHTPSLSGQKTGRRLLSMGNIGYSQGLPELVRAFERSSAAEAADARLVLAGSGVASEAVRAEVRSGRVEFRGLLADRDLGAELGRASLGVVSQRPDVAEFNLPSKLMNYMALGLPVLASVREGSEVERLVRESGAGWVTDSSRPEDFAAKAAAILADESELDRRGAAGLGYARLNFAPTRIVDLFEELLQEVHAEQGPVRGESRRLRAPLDRLVSGGEPEEADKPR